jgi:acyl carrier protein
MPMTHDEVFAKVQTVLVDALGVDEEEVTPQATLTGDLNAESIDFLDIVFRLEKAFNIKISQGELFPDNVLQNPDYVKDGQVTDQGVAVLKQRMPHADFTKFDADRSLDNVAEIFTVSAVVKFVESKLK